TKNLTGSDLVLTPVSRSILRGKEIVDQADKALVLLDLRPVTTQPTQPSQTTKRIDKRDNMVIFP
ncbi:hypothetical protein, partial [Cupriavidus sp. WS]|uniref:hypothetical protein n=1 Tax=Cupriavidus sp. WS TaxID=1312922 RepID=UPI001E340504